MPLHGFAGALNGYVRRVCCNNNSLLPAIVSASWPRFFTIFPQVYWPISADFRPARRTEVRSGRGEEPATSDFFLQRSAFRLFFYGVRTRLEHILVALKFLSANRFFTTEFAILRIKKKNQMKIHRRVLIFYCFFFPHEHAKHDAIVRQILCPLARTTRFWPGF